MGSMGKMIHLTLYQGGRAPVPIRQDDFDSWDECADALEDIVAMPSGAPAGASVEDQKLKLLAFAPHRLKPDSECVNGKGESTNAAYRHLDNVLGVTLLVIDVDACNIDDLGETLEAFDIDAIMYTSPSDDPYGPDDMRRVRVITPVDRVIAVDECRQTRRAFAEALGLGPASGVDGAPDAARIFFAGRLHDTPERTFFRFKAGT